jgi:hypothetical protein
MRWWSSLLSVGVITITATLVVTVGAFAQQGTQCFDVSRNTTGDPIGAILVNRCTGDTWLLVSNLQGGNTTVRWYPISRAQGETIIPH